MAQYMYANQEVNLLKPLSKELRNKLERTIESARELAEEAARIALEQLGVGEASPYSYLSDDERALRRSLRAHGRNLGDVRNSITEIQEIDILVEEIAYEHWHRMLFARFLSENDLLMYYDDDDIENAVPVTLSECVELAQELGLKTGWEMAAKLATKMLPQVFRSDSPVFKVILSPEKQRELEKLISNIEGDVFKASDSLGWAYQFWQNKKKELINKSESKIGAKELPAVTQLFTDSYMVDFLLDNSIGALWASKKIQELENVNIEDEDELRKVIATDEMPLKYTRFVKNESDEWMVASGVHIEIYNSLSELKVLDPSCGSGHFLVSAFKMLVKIRMDEENLTAEEACNAVLKDNLYGLEIDQRCVEIAAFSVALNAWKYPNTSGFRIIPELNIAWCGQSFNIKKDEWLSLANNDSKLNFSLENLYTSFQDAPLLGSLLNPESILLGDTMFEDDWVRIKQLINKKYEPNNYDRAELVVAAQGIERALYILSQKYDVVVTNVPYLKGGNQSERLKIFCEKNYPDSKYDLANVFIERIIKLLKNKGTLSVVTQQAWLFSKYFENLRKKLLDNIEFGLIARLGPNAFEAISGEHVNVALMVMHNNTPDTDYVHCGLELDEYNSPIEKASGLLLENVICVKQESQKYNPTNRIIFDVKVNEKREFIYNYADFGKGSVSGDRPHYIRFFWEVRKLNSHTKLWLNSPQHEISWSGREEIILWGDDFHPEDEIGFRYHGQRVFNKRGIAIAKTGKLRFTPYSGELFDDNVVVISPYNEKDYSILWCYITSGDFVKNVRKIDKKLCVTAGTFPQVRIEYSKYEKSTPDIDIYEPHSNDPTQWIFHGHPSKSSDPLQVAVARLLGFCWPAELDAEMELSDEARVLVTKSQSLLSFADNDGIVCIPSVRGEVPAAERLLNLLAAAYKDEDVNMILTGLLSDADHAGKSLESWLRDEFFTHHYKLFGHRPFIWQIWDGLKDGFSALVNYHKLDRKNLETLIYTYLGDWINKQKSDMVDGVEGAEEKLNAAINLKKKLELILEGESPYDIFVRWKPISKQPLGWVPDLNDGVRINIRPFISVSDVGKKGAGVLRDKPNIKWTKDRGKDTENSPWYHLFGGDRINDHHLTLEEKKKTREEMR